MKLYPKKLRNIDDLRKERKRLMKETAQLETEGISLAGLAAAGASGNDDKASFLDYLPISNPLVRQLLDFAISRLTKKKTKSPKECEDDEAPRKSGKSLLKRAAVEFIGGYLKWKAIELSFKGARYIIKKRKEKKEESRHSY
jgi:hypothetical protein